MISQMTVNRNKWRLLKYNSYGYFVKKYQAIGDQYGNKTVNETCHIKFCMCDDSMPK